MHEDILNLFHIHVTKMETLLRSDSGNGNEMYIVNAREGNFVLKEIPGHSLSGNLETIFSELQKANPKKFLMVLPLPAKDGKCLVTMNGKTMMMFPFVSHQVLMESDTKVDTVLAVLEDFFSAIAHLNIPPHPFKTYANWYERGIQQLKKKIPDHPLITMLEEFYLHRFPQLQFREGNTHFDLNPYNFWITGNTCSLSDFDTVQVAAYAKDVVDSVSVYLRDYAMEDDVFQKILDFLQTYATGLTARDLRLMLARTKLGILFDPASPYSLDEIRERMTLLQKFCEK